MLTWGFKRFAFTLAAIGCFIFPVIAQDGLAQSSLQDIILVLDNSGSMKKNDPAFLTKAAVKAFVQRASASIRSALVIFDSDARLVVPLTPLAEKQSSAVLSGLDQINYRGLLTNIPAAMERALYELNLNSRPHATKSIILLTDGLIDTGDPVRDADAGKWLREELATDAARHEIKFFGIALTDKADFRLLQSLALTTKGDYFRAHQVEELPPIFERIHQLIGRAVAAPSPPDPEAYPQEAKETPSFVTVEVMGKENVPGDPAESLAATGPLDSPGAPSLTQQAPFESFSLFSLQRSAVLVFAVTVLGILVTMVWVLARRQSKPPKTSGTSQTPVASVEPIPSAFLHDLKNVTGQSKHALIHPVTVIGRVAPDPVENANSVVLHNAEISRRHALIEYKQHSFWVIDQKSGNGTFVNGERIKEETRLRHGDRIRFHKLEFQFELAASGAADETRLINTALPRKDPLIAKAR